MFWKKRRKSDVVEGWLKVKKHVPHSREEQAEEIAPDGYFEHVAEVCNRLAPRSGSYYEFEEDYDNLQDKRLIERARRALRKLADERTSEDGLMGVYIRAHAKIASEREFFLFGDIYRLQQLASATAEGRLSDCRRLLLVTFFKADSSGAIRNGITVHVYLHEDGRLEVESADGQIEQLLLDILAPYQKQTALMLEQRQSFMTQTVVPAIELGRYAPWSLAETQLVPSEMVEKDGRPIFLDSLTIRPLGDNDSFFVRLLARQFLDECSQEERVQAMTMLGYAGDMTELYHFEIYEHIWWACEDDVFRVLWALHLERGGRTILQ